MVAIVVTESFKFAASTVIFLHHLIKALLTYVTDAKIVPATKLKGQGLTETLPEKLPSIVDLKRALPKHCFERRVSTSMYYVVKDFIQVALAFYAILYLMAVPSTVFQAVAMFMYWAVQGTFFTALFVIGHDCGHASFSDYPLLDDIIGTITHSFLMCPYYMWKMSHRIHHKNNSNFDKDEVFYPMKKSEPCAQGPVGIIPGFGFGIGWFAYLLVGYTPRSINHFNPWQKAFAGHFVGCVLSLAGLATMAFMLYLLYLSQGLFGLICYWAVPNFVFASYSVIITFLHHSEMNIPWYSDEKWDFVRGQLSTIDRHYGIVHSIIHSIGTHQMHHMFTKIPHYHLEEATRHFRQAFPHLVRTCEEPIPSSFMRMFKVYRKQIVIDDDTKVHRYQ